jgi:hypothetical protein
MTDLIKRRELIADYRGKVASENERNKATRNARRWKEERDPVEYEAQKVQQKVEYAAKIAEEEGREVRAYVKVPGKTVEERERNRLARKAEKEAARRSTAPTATKHKNADRMWIKRKKAAGWTPGRIAEGLAQRHADRQTDPGEYENNPLYGAF